MKQLLTSTATDLGHPAYEQGAGLLNSLAAVQAAESWNDANGAPAPTGTTLVVEPDPAGVSGNPGDLGDQDGDASPTSAARRQVVTPSARTLGTPVSSVNGTDTLNTATAPTYVDAFGTVRSYVAQTFTVGANVDQLDVSNAARCRAASRSGSS